MRKEITIHFLAALFFFTSLILFRQLFSPIYVVFVLWVVVGTILPDIDHLIYIYYLRPDELASQKVKQSIKAHGLFKTLELLSQTRHERSKLNFHTIWFQILFLALTFWVLTSTNSIFGKGFVTAFSLHLLVDQICDLLSMGNLNNWTTSLSFKFTQEKSIFYWIIIFGLLVTISFLFW